jgi:hypothetical protein
MSLPEPGLDRHAWESELESLREGLADAPTQALPDLADLVGRMLAERGYQEGDDPEVLASYRASPARCEELRDDADGSR